MKSTVFVISCIIFFAIFFYATITLPRSDTGTIQRPTNAKVNRTKLKFTDRPDHLMWFLQISDIHISIFHDDNRIQEFREFATKTLDAIKPKVVLASGDLTDGKDKVAFGSRQYESEWKIYGEIVTDANVRDKTLWMDIRGNHDNFNVANPMADDSFFHRYSIQGAKHKRSYMELVHGDNGEVYSFMAVDACIEPGAKRPFNFIGMLTQNDTDHIQQLVRRARQAGTNYTIWFGHYPTSCIMTLNDERKSFQRIIAEDDTGLVYMCGHLHTLAGMVPRMYVLQHNSFLELELGDWKSTRLYRVAAIDHGIFSFVDVKHNEWPVILITNPNHALFHIPNREEARMRLDSTHIRVLAFAPAAIEKCSISINDESPIECQKVTENLFVVKWDPKKYANGLHHITVNVSDRMGNENQVKHPFQLTERNNLSFDLLARMTLLIDTTTVFKYSFLFALSVCVVPLIYFRICHSLVMAGKLKRQRSKYRTSMSCRQQFWILSTINRLFWPIIGYCIYLAVGPWSYCEVVDEKHYGFVFVWGIYVDGVILPSALNYLYGFFQLMFCQFPLIWIYSKYVKQRYYEVTGIPKKKHRGSLCSLRKLSHVPFFVIICIEIALAIVFGLSYGTVAFLFGPFRTWSVIMNATLWYLSRTVPDNCLRSAISAWSANGSDGEQPAREDSGESLPTSQM